MTTYYVSATGSANGTGSQSSPFTTISQALDANLKPGDTIMVEPGTYNEVLNINTGGSAAGNITVESAVPGGALIRPPAGSFNAISINASYVTVEGFDVKGGSGAGIAGTSVAHVSVLNNVVHDSGQSGISFVHSDFETIEGNTTYNNASTGYYSGISVWENQNVTGDTTTTGYRTIIANNTSYDNVTKTGTHSDGNGIIVDDFQATQNSSLPAYNYPTLVQGNTVYGNGGKGIQVYDSNNVTVANNTAYHNNTDPLNTGTWRGEISNSGGNNNTFVNNIAVADPSVNSNNTAISNTSTGGANQNVVWADNITYNGAAGQASVNNDGGNSVPTAANGNMIGVNPEFVQAGSDFHLQSSSPAVNAGATGYGLAAIGAVNNIGADGVSGTASTTGSSGSSGTTSTSGGSTTTTTGNPSSTGSTGSSGTTSTSSGSTTTTTGDPSSTGSTGSSGTTSTSSGSTTTTTGDPSSTGSTGSSGTTSTSGGSTTTTTGNPSSTGSVHDAGIAFNGANSQLSGGINSGNQASIVSDLNTAKADLQNAVTTQGLTGQALQDAEKVMSLLGKEAALVSSIDTTNPTHVSGVYGQIAHVQSQILNTVSHDATLAAQTVGTDGTTGFAPLSSTVDPTHQAQNDFSLHHLTHLWG